MAEGMEFTGVVRTKKIIELDEEIPLPNGSPVRLRLVSENAPDVREDEEADKTLRAIYQMRRQGRSVQKP
jgi:hypothetical protein